MPLDSISSEIKNDEFNQMSNKQTGISGAKPDNQVQFVTTVCNLVFTYLVVAHIERTFKLLYCKKPDQSEIRFDDKD